MGSKKRIYFVTPQKRVKQRWKDQYEAAKLRPKVKHPYVEINKNQKIYINNYLNVKGFYPVRSVFNFYSRLHILDKFLQNSIFNLNIGFTILNYAQKKLNLIKWGVSPKVLKKKIFRNDQNKRLRQLYSLTFFENIALASTDFEVQTLFLLCNSNQQHHLNTLGIDYRYFKTISSGRCMRSNFGYQVSKSLKKSPQLNKALVDYYFEESTIDTEENCFTHTIIRPFNKKALILFDQIQDNALYYPTILGFTKYYKTNFKTARRIKKKIKKMLTSENTQRKPYKKH